MISPLMVSVHTAKTQIVHFRKKSTPVTNYIFKCGENLDVVLKYKYLGIILDEHLDFTTTANTLTDSAGRAVDSLINRCIKTNKFIYETYTKLYDVCDSNNGLCS